MQKFTRFTLLSLFFLAILFVGAIYLAVEDVALLHNKAIMTPEHIARGKRVFQLNDPRRLHHGEIGRAILNQEDVDLAINYFANQFADAIAGLRIEPWQAILESTFNLPENPLGRFVNVRIQFKQTQDMPQIDRIWIGKLWIPGILADVAVKSNLSRLQSSFDWQKLYDMV